jgi:hydroxymethylbilane synthase
MPTQDRPIIIATRGSALALAQAKAVHAQCCNAFPRLSFDLKIIKTTGDKMQTASLAKDGESLPKGLFTKELEVALLKHQADLAIHSLKDLPTELPDGLSLGAVSKRADVRDVLIYRDADHLRAFTGGSGTELQRTGFKPKLSITGLPQGATVGTSSTRRKSQLLARRPDLKIAELRGNVLTRLQKLADRPELGATILAAAGLGRLNYCITGEGKLTGGDVPDGLLATILDPDVMLPCVGQGALGIETRVADERLASICERLNHFHTQQCVVAERAFLAAMGGGCQSPVAAYAEIIDEEIRMRAVSFRDKKNVRRCDVKGPIMEADVLGKRVAEELA